MAIDIAIPPAIRTFADTLPALGPWRLLPPWCGKRLEHIRSADPDELDKYGVPCCPVLRFVGAARYSNKDAMDLGPLCGLSDEEANLVVCAADNRPDESDDPDHVPAVAAVRALLLEKCGLAEVPDGG